ncbi:MAG: hypothetical protein WBN75_13990 [Verrucomicrobiia bacterium]
MTDQPIKLSEKAKTAVRLIEAQVRLQNEIEKFVTGASEGCAPPTVQSLQAILASEIISAASLPKSQAAG